MRLFEGITEALYPTRCAGCDMPGSLLCPECRRALAIIEACGACPACGAPYGALVCTECWNVTYAFSASVCLGVLERPLSRAVTMFKDAGEVRLAGELARLLAPRVLPWSGWADAIVAVPASGRAIRRRGFDHGALLASALAHEVGVPHLQSLVSVGRADQRRLGRAGRRSNAGSALEVRAGCVVPRQVIVVDDVFTTGATLDAAASVLLEAGATEVRVCALARAW